MNTTTTPNHNAGSNWFAFLFGAVFNLMAGIDLSFFGKYILQAIAGGIVCLAFKVLGDILSPLWLKQKERVSKFTRARKIKSRMRKKKRSHEN